MINHHATRAMRAQSATRPLCAHMTAVNCNRGRIRRAILTTVCDMIGLASIFGAGWLLLVAGYAFGIK